MKERRNKTDEVTWTDNDDFLDLSEHWEGDEAADALDTHLKASLHEPHEPEPEHGDDLVDEYDEALIEEYEARAIDEAEGRMLEEEAFDLLQEQLEREFEATFEDIISKRLDDLFERGPDWEREKEME